MMVSPMLGYVFSRLHFPGKNLFFILFIGIIALPPWPVLIGLFSQFSYLHLLDTKIGLILLSFTYRIPFETWFMKSYFEAVPKDVEDAARIDGCTHLGTLIPGQHSDGDAGADCGIDHFFSVHLEYVCRAISPDLYIEIKTIDCGDDGIYRAILCPLGSDVGGGSGAIIPPVLVVLLFQKFIVKGLTAGAVKA